MPDPLRLAARLRKLAAEQLELAAELEAEAAPAPAPQRRPDAEIIQKALAAARRSGLRLRR